jgi:hypothetical protein
VPFDPPSLIIGCFSAHQICILDRGARAALIQLNSPAIDDQENGSEAPGQLLATPDVSPAARGWRWPDDGPTRGQIDNGSSRRIYDAAGRARRLATSASSERGFFREANTPLTLQIAIPTFIVTRDW